MFYAPPSEYGRYYTTVTKVVFHPLTFFCNQAILWLTLSFFFIVQIVDQTVIILCNCSYFFFFFFVAILDEEKEIPLGN